MSSGPARRDSRKDIQLVQSLIGRCLPHYMNQKEVVDYLLNQAKIEPRFTEFAWHKLEEENKEFFKAYYLMLMLKHQILEFNKLLEQHVYLTRQVSSTGADSLSTSNGSHIPPMPQNSTRYSPENKGSVLKQEDLHYSVSPSLPNVFRNGSSSLLNGMHGAVEIPAGVAALPPMLSNQTSNAGLMQGINGGMVKSEPGFMGHTPFIFGADVNVLEAHPPIGSASVASFSSGESSSQPLNLPLDAEISSSGFLGQFPQSFSLSELSAEPDMLESYNRSCFQATETDDFFDACEREHQGEDKRLDIIHEGGFEDYGN